MIETFYGLDQLVLAPGPKTFFVALLIGVAFGFALERAGFGSSRRLAGIFYFRDMAVLKVMFTALITAMLGLSFVVAMGWLDLESQVSLLPTMYGAQAVGGLIFGVGFVLSGWCPGTAAVGMGSGKLDALVFLVGVVGGSVLYNETYAMTEGIRSWGAFDEPQVAFGFSTTAFGLLFTLAAVVAFYAAEWIESRRLGGGRYLKSPFLRALSMGLVIFATALFLFPGPSERLPGAEGGQAGAVPGAISDQALLESVEAAEDHLHPEQLADRLMSGEADLLVVDVRSPAEYAAFHIPGAVNVPLPELIDFLTPYQNLGTIVLYSNGMTHPAQARDVLARRGFTNAYMLTDGLQGFLDRCLTPVSLRREPLPAAEADRVRAWREFFLGEGPVTERAGASPPAGAL